VLLASDDEAGAELIRTIEADPYDSNALAIYGDWLQARGQPRGELVALQLAAERDPNKRKFANAFLSQHSRELLGELAPFHTADPKALTWRYGFIHRARFVRDYGRGVDALTNHASGRFVVEISTGPSYVEADPELHRVVDSLCERAPCTLHVLQLGVNRPSTLDVWRTGVDLAELWGALPRLRRLVVDGGFFRYGAIDLPQLEHAELRTGGLNRRNLDELSRSELPQLRHLDLVGDHDWAHGEMRTVENRVTTSRCASTIEHFDRFLAAARFPALRHLGVRQCVYTNDVVASLARWPGLRALETLDLSCGILTERGARTLQRNADAFRHLAVLDVSRNYLSPRGIARLQGLAHRVISGGQLS
jgi:uncharacterized protein (TIGR02996 family)